MDVSVHQLDLASLPKWQGMLNRFRVLWVSASSDSGEWLIGALSRDRTCKVELVHASSHAAGLRFLREESFGLILVQHDEAKLDGAEFVAACRGGGHEEPLIVMGMESATALQPLCTEAGADDYLCMEHCSTRGLLWSMSRACQRWELQRENRRLEQNESQRNQSEQREVERLLAEQIALIGTGEVPLAEEIAENYLGLLRAYVIMGSGTLDRELRAIILELLNAGATAKQTMQMHLQAVESLLQGQGKRSSRHILVRADLLILEVMMNLVDKN